jgi:hypothetical protein
MKHRTGTLFKIGIALLALGALVGLALKVKRRIETDIDDIFSAEPIGM